jgi:hypothetical protein
MSTSPTKETWKNVTKGKRHVVKYDPKGNIVTEIIKAGATVMLTPEEREINMERAANEKLCIFKNGSLIPVRVLDEEVAKEFASNPNNASDTELKALFKAQWKTFDSRVSEIDNVYTLERLRDLAESEEIGATVRQHNTILGRIEEVSERKVEESDRRIMETTASRPTSGGLKPWQTM